MSDFWYQVIAWTIAAIFIGGYSELYKNHFGWALAVMFSGVIVFDLFLGHFRGVKP